MYRELLIWLAKYLVKLVVATAVFYMLFSSLGWAGKVNYYPVEQAKKDLWRLQDSLRSYLVECKEYKSGYKNDGETLDMSVYVIQQACREIGEDMIVVVKKEIYIDFVELKFTREKGWKNVFTR